MGSVITAFWLGAGAFMHVVGGMAVPAMPDIHRSRSDTLPPYRDTVTTRSDSASDVRAANDALQGRHGVQVPMRTVRYLRSRGGIEVTLQPVTDSRVVWRNLGGTVRILPDGRRVIVERR